MVTCEMGRAREERLRDVRGAGGAGTRGGLEGGGADDQGEEALHTNEFPPSSEARRMVHESSFHALIGIFFLCCKLFYLILFLNWKEVDDVAITISESNDGDPFDLRESHVEEYRRHRYEWRRVS